MRATINVAFMAASLLGAVGSVSLLTGCQTPGQVLSVETSDVCPMCRTETRTTVVKGLSYKKHVCPSCRNIEDYEMIGERDVVEITHVCDKCEALVSKCEQCLKQ